MAWIISDKPAPFPWVIEDTVRDSEVAIGPVNSGWTHDEEARIARLIASAPDLLDALESVAAAVVLVLEDVRVTNGEGLDALSELANATDKAHAAIAKATGE